MSIQVITLSFIIVTIFSGCGIGMNKLSPMQQATLKGDYKLAGIEADKEKDLESKLDESNQLPTLYAGNSYLYSKDFTKSLQRLDEAERIIKFHNEEILLGDTGDLIAQILLNDAVIDYHTTINGSIMVNTYKALDYISVGKMNSARIEFNRAIDRQRRAKEIYAKIIGKYKEAISQKTKEEQAKIAREKELARRNPRARPSNISLDVTKTLQNPNITNMVSTKYPALNRYKVYSSFINPFTNYLAGIFFTTQGDYKKAYPILKELQKIVPNSEAIQKDLTMVNDILNGKKVKENNVWVIYSNGLAPKKEQFKINIPLFIVTNRISYSGIALPKMVTQKLATRNLSVFDETKFLANSEIFASMDKIVLTEFKYKYSDIVTRAVFGALIKTYIQYEAGRNFGGYGSLAMGLIQFALTQADTRTWENLPKEYQVARITMPESKNLQLKIGIENINIDLGDAKNAIVFVRKPTPLAKVSYNIMKL